MIDFTLGICCLSRDFPADTRRPPTAHRPTDWVESDACAVVFQLCPTHAHFNISARESGAKLKPHGNVCLPFSSSLAPGRVYFDDVTVFSPSTLENSVFKKHRFQIAPLWRAFLNGSVFGDRFQRCSVDDSRIRSKTVQFSFENGLVWTGH